jgi:hypothetical protein
MVKADKNKQYSFALIAIVAIVAIVGIVMMFMNSQPRIGIEASTEQSTFLGAATTTTCADSDGGKNYNLKGTTVKGTTIKTDSCSGQQLTEYYCASNKVSSVIYDCSKAGKVCLNGACISPSDCGNGIIEAGEQCDGANLGGKTCASLNFTSGKLKCSMCKFNTSGCSLVSCTDSDGGINYYVKGYVTGYFGKKEDVCFDNNYLNEATCDSYGNYLSVGYTCPYGCANGACKTCNDTDGGKNYYVKGEVYNGSSWLNDYCFDANILDEGYCSPNIGFQIDWYNCPFGCSDGACIMPVNETDLCLFFGSDGRSYNYCTSQYSNCSGIYDCYAIAIGPSGTTLNWSSNCAGTSATTLDGISKNITFDC